MIRTINIAANAAGDAVLAPFRAAGPWPMMIWASLVTAAFALVVIRLTGDREALRRARGRQTARALEILLFKDDMAVSFGALGRLFAAVLAYQKQFLRPLLVMLVPVVLFMIQLAGWFDARPLRPGETAVVKAVFGVGAPTRTVAATLSVSDNLAGDTLPLRIPVASEIAWRCSARSAGPGWVELDTGAVKIRKDVIVTEKPARVSKRRVMPGFWAELANPGESPLPPDTPVIAVEMGYPPSRLMLGTRRVHWLLAFFVLTMVFGALLKRPFGAEF